MLDALSRMRMRWRAQTHRLLQDSPGVSEVIAVLYLAGSVMPLFSRVRRAGWLLAAAKRGRSHRVLRILQARLAAVLTPEGGAGLRTSQVGWARYRGSFGRIDTHKDLTTSLLLKRPGPNGEKGVLYSAFEYNWMRLLAHHDAKRFLESYYLIGASSYSPTDYTLLANFAGLSRSPLLIGVSNLRDLPVYSCLAPVIQPLPLMACDWNDPDEFTPQPLEARDVDIIMVANWLRLKRHWLLFEALARMPRNLRVVLIGREADGRTHEDIRQEARAFGARQELEIHTSLSHDQVVGWLARARLATLFTKREGSCVAVTEAMLANTPVAMMANAHVGAIAHINPRTGRLLHRTGLGAQLQEMLERRPEYAPRAWALEHITADKSSATLNDTLRALALREGTPWTNDIAPLCLRYVPSYLRAEDGERLAPGVAELKSMFGVTLVPFGGERKGQASRQPGVSIVPETARGGTE